jgi:hypothetical protein
MLSRRRATLKSCSLIIACVLALALMPASVRAQPPGATVY